MSLVLKILQLGYGNVESRGIIEFFDFNVK